MVDNVSLKLQKVDQARERVENPRQISEAMDTGRSPWENAIRRRADRKPAHWGHRKAGPQSLSGTPEKWEDNQENMTLQSQKDRVLPRGQSDLYRYCTSYSYQAQTLFFLHPFSWVMTIRLFMRNFESYYWRRPEKHCKNLPRSNALL